MPKFKVWLNDAGYEPMGSMALAHRREATVIDVEAAGVHSKDGELQFTGAEIIATSVDGQFRTPLGHPIIEAFAKGIWTRWKVSS